MPISLSCKTNQRSKQGETPEERRKESEGVDGKYQVMIVFSVSQIINEVIKMRMEGKSDYLIDKSRPF